MTATFAGMREVGKARSLPHLLIVMLRREGERVIDAVGVAGARHDGGPWAKERRTRGSINIAHGAWLGQTPDLRYINRRENRCEREVEHKKSETLHDDAESGTEGSEFRRDWVHAMNSDGCIPTPTMPTSSPIVNQVSRSRRVAADTSRIDNALPASCRDDELDRFPTQASGWRTRVRSARRLAEA